MRLLTNLKNHESNSYYRYLLGGGGSDDRGSEDQELSLICQTSNPFVEASWRDPPESLDMSSNVESSTMGILVHWFPGLDLGIPTFGSTSLH